jgi:hypothetical protein
MVMYHNCGGERMDSYIDSVSQTIYGDTPKQLLLDFELSVMNFKERGYRELAAAGLSADSVYRETKRSLDALVDKKTLVWPGIDIDIPTNANSSHSTPQSTKDAVLAAFHAGAQGVILSRKYSEMKLANLKAAGDAVRELGFA